MPLVRRRDVLRRSTAVLLAALLATAGGRAWADTDGRRSGLELSRLAVSNGEDGVRLSYDVRFDLPRDLEDALSKGIAVTFVAEVELRRKRWYWTDESIARAVRRWRLAYQPLTRQWRVSVNGLHRQFAELNEALDSLRQASGWRLADTIDPSEAAQHYVEFAFELDKDELPRPLQIGVGLQSDWNLRVERRLGLAHAR